MVRTKVLKHLPGAREGERRESKRDIRGEATARGAMGKSRCVRVIEGEEVRINDLIEYTGVGSTF